MSEITEDEIREPTLAYIAKLEAALREIANDPDYGGHRAQVYKLIAQHVLDQTPPKRLDTVEEIVKALLMEGRITPNTARALMASAQSSPDGK